MSEQNTAPDDTQSCIHCGETKPLTEYYKHPKMSNGRLGACKECHKDRMRANHRKRINEPGWREKERARARKKWRQHGDKWKNTPAHSHKAAHTAVSNAVRDGRLTPADTCEDCGHDFSDFRREGHHEDYSKPLDVVWLCSLCHGKRHRID